MTTTALEPAAPTITPDHLALVRTTIAKDATPAELELFLYDCQRRGVHPLDRLLHFTKRGGRYTPVTSIDFMRTRAATTGECAGIDDAIFTGTPKTADFRASVTVWRLVQGVRCAFTATAYWTEYKPDQDFMWQKMPHVMLSKVAEALALRRGFPAQLAGLYASEELAQADTSPQPRPSRENRGTTMRELREEASPLVPVTDRIEREAAPMTAPAPVADVVDTTTGEVNEPTPDTHRVEGLVEAVELYKQGSKKGRHWRLYRIRVDDMQFSTFDSTIAADAEQAMEQRVPVTIESVQKNERLGREIVTLTLTPLSADELPF